MINRNKPTRNEKIYLNKILLFVLAISVVFFQCSKTDLSSSDTRTVLNISDFGAIPNDGKDDTPAVKKALEEIRKTNKKTALFFDCGRYDFFSISASTVHYPVTAVHKQWDFVTPFHLDKLKDMIIDGGGSTFMMHGRMTPFVINACKNINITRLSIGQERPSVFELRVVSKKDHEIDFEVIGNDQFVLEDHRIVWLDADDKRQIPNVFQYYDPLKDITQRCPDPLKDATLIKRLDKNRIRVNYVPGSELLKDIRSGEVFQFRFDIRNQSGVVVYESQKISFDHLNVYSWNGLGFVCQFSRDLSFNRLLMEPNPSSGRTNAGFADAIHIFACQGDILIENSHFAGLHDDHIITYGQMMKVTRINSPGMLEAVFPFNETEGFRNFRKGDRIVFHNPNTLEAETEGTVVDSKLLDDKTLRISLDADIPEIYQSYWIENLTWIPEKVIIRGNYFGRVPTRSILMYVAHDAVIENNIFHRIPMATILMKCPDQQRGLQNHVENLKVLNNVFYECEGTLINSYPQVRELSEDAHLYGALEVKDNLIIMHEKTPPFIDIRGFSRVNVGQNIIELVKPHDTLAFFSDCKEIQLSPQLILGVHDTPKVLLQRVTNYSGEGWIQSRR